jgi:hypothetical protein
MTTPVKSIPGKPMKNPTEAGSNPPLNSPLKETRQQSAATIESPALEDRIRDRAFQIWLEKGCPHGRDAENWRQAESELTQSQSSQ